MLPPFVGRFRENGEMEDALPEILELPRAFGRRLRLARKRVGLTAEALGEKLDLSGHSPVTQWERGATLPETLNLIFSAEYCSASIDYLVWGMGNDIDARVRALPGQLREQLTNEFMLRIEQAEQLAREHPEVWTESRILDADKRLKPWSAKRKQEYARALAKRKGGSAQ